MSPNSSQNPFLVMICTVSHPSLLHAQFFAIIATLIRPWKENTLHVHYQPDSACTLTTWFSRKRCIETFLWIFLQRIFWCIEIWKSSCGSSSSGLPLGTTNLPLFRKYQDFHKKKYQISWPYEYQIFWLKYDKSFRPHFPSPQLLKI